MLTCQHHIQWVRQVAGGLHQCILCTQVVTKKDVYPKLEDLPEEFRRRWDAHEATRPAPEPASAEAPPKTKPTPQTPASGGPPRAPHAAEAPADASGASHPAPTAPAPPRAATTPRPPPARSVSVPPPASHEHPSSG